MMSVFLTDSLRMPLGGYFMPTVNFYLNEKYELSTPGLMKIIKFAHGKTLKIQLKDNEFKDGKVKVAADFWKKKFLLWIVPAFGGKNGADKKLLISSAKVDGKIVNPGSYTFMITLNRKRIKATLEVVAPAGAAAVAEPKYTFSNSKVKGQCGKKEITKIRSIALEGKGYTGHGPVPYLKNALHAHVTNTAGIGWQWKGDTMHVVAWGKKNNQNKEQQIGGKGPKLKTCQYDWTT
jgi:hypothetical protein